MFKRKTVIEREILRDCRHCMLPSTLLYIVQETLTGVLSISIADKLGAFFDSVLELNFAGGMSNVFVLVGCVLIGAVGLPFFDFVGECVMLNNSLKHDRVVMRHFLRKKYLNVMQMDEGEAEYRLENDSIELRYCWQEIPVKLVATAAAGGYLLFFALRISWIYFLIIVLISAIKLVVPVVLKRPTKKYDKLNKEYCTNVRVYENALTKATWYIKMLGMAGGMLERAEDLYRTNLRKLHYPRIFCSTFEKSASKLLEQVCTLLIVLSGAWLVARGSISLGNIAAMMGYFAVFNLLIENIKSIIKNKVLLKNVLERMVCLYDACDSSGGVKLSGVVNSLKVEQLQYCYGEEKISYGDFCVEGGEKVAICGVNGSGKSTLIKLLCGLLTDYQGHILINGVEIKDIAAESLYRQIAYIEQAPYLFEGTVLENIMLAGNDRPREEARKLAEAMGIEDLLDRKVNFGENSLSGGEIQKVAIARALFRNSTVLLLDEPCNNLDSGAREWLKNFIRATKQTVIFVTHNEELAGCADRKISILP